VDDLARCMNASVCSSCRKCLDWAVWIKLADRVIQLGLHAVAIDLTLPAAKR
jgi:hypothetical protein|tara:strand:- start:310 stop:465 length:156 start_codon:yes stop_codon:yes gene_type:complete